MCSINVFNASLMNDAIFKFKRYEDNSIAYTGLDMLADMDEVGGWDTSIMKDEYDRLFKSQQGAMETPKIAAATETPVIPKLQPKPPTKPKTTLVTAQYGIKPAPTPKPTEPSKPKKAEIDLSGVKVGAEVKHKKFGMGKIVKMDKAEKYVYVQFAVGEKRFVFPDAFVQGFLLI